MKHRYNLIRRGNMSFLFGAGLVILLAFGTTFELLAQNSEIKPDKDVKVTSFSPERMVDRQTNITIKFSNQMVPKDSLDLIVENPPLYIEPAIPGVARWIETDILRFYPDNLLLPATEYKAKINSSDNFINGNRINEDREFVFNTPYLNVTDSYWNQEPIPDKPGFVQVAINLYFNYEVDLNRIKKLIKLKRRDKDNEEDIGFDIDNLVQKPINATRDLPSLDSETNQYADYVRIITDSISATLKQQEIELTIDKDLKCRGCKEGLQKDYSLKMTVRKYAPLHVRRAFANVAGDKGKIRIDFSDKIVTENIKDLITIRPEIDFLPTASYNYVDLQGDFKIGETYEVTVSKNMRSVYGTTLNNEFSTRVTIPNLPTTIKFASEGKYLPRNGNGLLEIETINCDSLTVDVEQIFSNNLVYALTGNYLNRRNYYGNNLKQVGRPFFDKTLGLENTLNEPLTTTVDIGGIISDTARGIFKVNARSKNNRWLTDSRIAMRTNIGIIARKAEDYLMVWANSLDEVKPVAGATVKLYSYNNQVLLEGQTDSRGIIVFEQIDKTTEGFEPFLITVEKNNDLSFLLFRESLLPIDDFDVKGRPYLSTGYEAFLYPDRELFRPGDTANIVSLVRGADGALPPEFPYLIEVIDPTGRKFKAERLNTGKGGLLETVLPIPTFAKTGKYNIIARIGDDYEIGRTSIQVEEFMPDRIKTTVTTDGKKYHSGEKVRIDVSGKYLFGPPAAGQKTSGHIRIRMENFRPDGFSAYSFNDPEKEFAEINYNLKQAQLDDTGYYQYEYKIPDNLKPPSALSGVIGVQVFEDGGRPVAGYTNIMIHPYKRYIGLKLNFKGYAKINEPFEAGLVALDNDGVQVKASSVKVMFYRMIYHSILKKDSKGRYRYVSERKPQLIDSAFVDITDKGGKVRFTPSDYGSYKLVAIDTAYGHSTAVNFYASGWGYSPWSMEEPDRIKIDFDKESYNPGDQAKIQIRAPFGGRLLLTIEQNDILDFITYEMEDNTAEITVPVKSDYFPNAYITATVIRKAADIEKSSPARAYGIAPMMLMKSAREIAVDLDAPEVMKPNRKLKVAVQLDQPGVSEMTIAAVDAGIVQLTGFTTPDPLEFFYGQRQLYLKPYDIYSFIYPHVEQAASHLSPAGGKFESFGTAADEARHLNPFKAERVKPVALWSGIVKTDEAGKAVVEFDVPQFNGKLILMAVAVKDDLYGSATSAVTVRDEIVIQENFPRFLSPNDLADGLITIYNNTGKASDITVTLNTDGPVKVIGESSQKIHLSDNTEGNVIFNLKSDIKPGVIKIDINADDEMYHSQFSFEMANRPAQPIKTDYGSGVVSDAVAAFFTFPDEWVKGTGKYTLKTSGLPALAFKKNIEHLLRYPYGCIEQTTSKLMPLLYFNSLAKFVNKDLVGNQGADYFIEEGLLKLSGMMRDDGYFSYWPGGSRIHKWSSVYASHAMLEAQKLGFYLDKDIERRIKSSLKQMARGNVSDIGIPTRIYAAYVLSGTGQLEKKIRNYLSDLDYDNIPPYARYLAAAALYRSGETEKAELLLPMEIIPDDTEPETGGTFSSGVRTNAILLNVLTEIDPQNPSCAVLAKDLTTKASIGRWYTTQASAFALMALGKYFATQENIDFDGYIDIQNDSTYNINSKEFQIVRDDLGGKNTTISVTGGGNCFYFWQAGGVPLSNAVDEFERGITIKREYLDHNGNRVSYDNIQIGDQLICHITAKATDRVLHNVVINDLIPAGLEIENPRLMTTNQFSWVPRIGNSIEYTDIRDDRMLLFTELNPNQSLEFYYSMRVIAAGEFKIPPVAAECMYNPTIAAATSSGVMKISR